MSQHIVTQETKEGEMMELMGSSSDDFDNTNHDKNDDVKNAAAANASTTRLVFADFLDVQTRLILMPWIEEEGLGAVVSSCCLVGPKEKEEEEKEDNVYSGSGTNVEGMILSRIDGTAGVGVGDADDNNKSKTDFGSMEFSSILAAIRQHPTPITLVFERPPATVGEVEKETTQSSPEAMEKMMVDEAAAANVDSNESPVIKVPVVEEEKKEDPHDTSQNGDGAAAPTSSTTDQAARLTLPPRPSPKTPPRRQQQHQQQLTRPRLINSALDDAPSTTSLSSGMSALSAWGLRMKAQSEKMAAGAMASVASKKEMTNQAGGSGGILGLSSPKPKTSDDDMGQKSSIVECDMYLQTNLGACFCISENAAATNKSSLQVTTSSLLLIRKSPTEAIPTQGYFFQWYRSSSRKTGHQAPFPASKLYESLDDSASIGASSRASETSSSADSSHAEDEEDWTPLSGATHAAFQPNATLVGRRLRCIVKFRKELPLTRTSPLADSLADSEDGLSRDDDENDDPLIESLDINAQNNLDDYEIVVCDLKEPVCADLTMFNGARQAISRGAKFGSLVGRKGSKAEGRTFRVEVSIARTFLTRQSKRPLTVNSVRLYLKDGDNYVAVTDQPILNVSARAHPAHGRHVDLVFPSLPPDSTVAIAFSELCVVADDNDNAPVLKLETINRMTRESLLLTLGIANFEGKPAAMDNKTVLYRDDEPTIEKLPQPATALKSLAPSSRFQSAEKSRKDEEDDSLSSGSEGAAGGAIFSSMPESPDHPPANVSAQSPSGFFSCKSNLESGQLASVPATPGSKVDSIADVPRPTLDADAVKKMKQMQEELDLLRSKLALKDKVAIELEHKMNNSDAAHQKTKQSLASCERELKQSQQDCERIQQSKRQVERTMQSHQESMQKVEAKHKAQVNSFEQQIMMQAGMISELEKLNRTLQNEKAVLGAAVEARESKLVKLGELKTSNDQLSQQVAQQQALHLQIQEGNQRYRELQQELDAISESEGNSRKELKDALSYVDQLKALAKKEQEKAAACYAQFEGLQKKNQQLKGERNNFKQKNDSLSKEISRLCRDGRNIRDIERIMADHDALLQEAEVLRSQKRKALEDAHTYRNLYEQVKAAEQLHGVEEDTRRALERTAELERLLSEMTDYVHAKEMQLETMKQVNEALQEEIKNLARANFEKNDV